jgi:hypothetical protein
MAVVVGILALLSLFKDWLSAFWAQFVPLQSTDVAAGEGALAHGIIEARSTSRRTALKVASDPSPYLVSSMLSRYSI